MANNLISYNLNIKLTQGETPVIEFFIYDQDGVSYPVSNIADVKWMVKQNANSPALITKALGGDISLGTGNIVKVQMIDTDTIPLLGNYVHQMVITDTAGNILMVKTQGGGAGTFIIDQRIVVP